MRNVSKILFLGLFGALSYASADEAVIRGIQLAPNQEALNTCAEKTGVVNCDVALPGDGEKFLEDLREKYLGHPLTEEEKVKIKRAIIRYYRKENHPAVDVQIQSQEDGVVAFIITTAEFAFNGEAWDSPDHLEKYIDISTSEYIAQDVLLNNVDYLNRNPFRRSIVLFPPDCEEGASDLKFLAGKRFPVRAFLGGDDSGTKFTGRSRLYGGLTWGHVFGRNDVIHYQYSCNPHLEKFQSHYGSYTAFLPAKNILTLSGLYETTLHDGKQLQTAFRYTVPLEPFDTDFKHEGTVGLDYKNLNTNRFFIETPPIRSRFVNIVQLQTNYSLERSWEDNEVEFAGELFLSPGKLLANQSNSAYRVLRPHAKNWYAYGRATLGDVYKLPHGFTVAGLLRLQVSTSPLLPTEQFGLGGYNTVRGYHERAFNADMAACINGELRFPSLTPIRRVCDELIFLGFIDYGVGFNLHSSAGNPKWGHLLGIGPGVRYQIDTHLSIRLDWGFRLHKVPGTSGRGHVAHLGVVGLF